MGGDWKEAHTLPYPACTRLISLMWLALLSGCGLVREAAPITRPVAPDLDQFGRVYYIDGAGDWGFGVEEVRTGLTRAGYQGNIVHYPWSPTYNPALDQTVGRPFARVKARQLAAEINEYLGSHPDRQVSIISLSAGTGVAVWACEDLDDDKRLHSLVMLASSLSFDYDMEQSLRHISKGVYVYVSRKDGILSGPVRVLGTIDGKVGVEPAGMAGLLAAKTHHDQIHNIGWSPDYERFGWDGSHIGATREPFVRHVLSKHVLDPVSEDAAVLEMAAVDTTASQ